MKKYTVYGNCQARVLPSVLGSSMLFKKQFQYVDIKAVHNMSLDDIEFVINDVLPSIDLFIFQPVSEKFKLSNKFSTNYLLSFLKPDCTQISFPSCYFRGYNPELIYLKGENNASITNVFDYHDSNIISGFVSGRLGQVEQLISAALFYDKAFSLKVVEESLQELEKREGDTSEAGEKVSVPISHFIRQNYQKERLFYTINHPTKALFRYLGKEIIKLLNIDDDITFYKDPLNHTVYPIYQSHYENLGLEFEEPLRYKVKGEEFDLATMVAKYAEYYSTLSKTILERNSEKSFLLSA